jgi:hypothetical protein
MGLQRRRRRIHVALVAASLVGLLPNIGTIPAWAVDITAPQLNGMTCLDALTALSNAGFVLGTLHIDDSGSTYDLSNATPAAFSNAVIFIYDAGTNKDTITFRETLYVVQDSQSIKNPNTAPSGSSMDIKCTNASAVPNIAGKSKSAAEALITSDSFTVGAEVPLTAGATADNNLTVVAGSISPTPGTLAYPQNNISFSYYSYDSSTNQSVQTPPVVTPPANQSSGGQSVSISSAPVITPVVTPTPIVATSTVSASDTSTATAPSSTATSTTTSGTTTSTPSAAAIAATFAADVTLVQFETSKIHTDIASQSTKLDLDLFTFQTTFIAKAKVYTLKLASIVKKLAALKKALGIKK